MPLLKSSSSSSEDLKRALSPYIDFFRREHIPFPGLTASAETTDLSVEDLKKRLAVFSYKQDKPFVWVVFLGGTGTGKSTLFNALCGKRLSETGVERPKTYGPIVYAHRDAPIAQDFPFFSIRIKRLPPSESDLAAHAGAPGELTVLDHVDDELLHLALVDTPDLDSLEVKNRRMAEDLYLLSDVVVFVASQEKYADEVLYQFLRRVLDEKKSYFFVLNKADVMLTKEELIQSFRAQGLELDEKRVRLLPHAPSYPFKWLREYPKFWDFSDSFFQLLSQSEISRFLEKQMHKEVGELRKILQSLRIALSKENEAAQKWTKQLDDLFDTACRDLLEQQKKHFSEESRRYLQAEIRKLFSQYDIFAKPRQLVAQLIRTPLRLLGFGGLSQPSHQEALWRVRQKIDLNPILISIEKFNRAVLENLSPSNSTSPLFRKLHRPEVMLTDEEVRQIVWREQDRLAFWLEETFQKLADEIPKSTKWGIYSTSALWGLLILSFEAAIGGGITVLEAAIDSAIAPFVTKGATELFAYREIERVARELAGRYQEGLLSVVREQRDRYANCLESLMPSQKNGELLQSMDQTLKSIAS